MNVRIAENGLEKNPPWMVQIVFDPDGRGHDFAYTIGLCELGVPELHMYARPSLVDDPGADWKFSGDDCCRMLNRLGVKAVRGQLPVGARFEHEYDGGLVRAAFRVDPPGDRDLLEAFGVAPGVDVLPVRWSLHRDPEGEPRPLDEVAEAQARVDYLLIATSWRSRDSHPRWTLPSRLSFDLDQRYGPLTPVVLGRAAQVWQAGPAFLADLLAVAGLIWAGTGSLTYPMTRAVSLARTVGRSAQLQHLVEDAHDLVDGFETEPEARERWQAAIEEDYGTELADPDPHTRWRVRRNLRGFLLDVVVSLLCAEAVADVADRDLLLSARGPLYAANVPRGLAPSHEWVAADAVLLKLVDLLGGLSRRRLEQVGRTHESWSVPVAPTTPARPSYALVQGRLCGLAMVSAAAAPDLGLLLGGPPPPGLQRWATVLTSALTHRPRLDAEEVTCLAAPFDDVLPRLAQVLNEPL